MIMTCHTKCFFLDRSIKPGQSIDVPEAMLDTDLVKASFRKPESPEEQKAAAEAAQATAAAAELSVPEMKRRLDEMGIKYKGNASRETLKNILAAQTSIQD
ncbi:MAG TPA: hypothetical protein P5204_08760 [Kiritimatiellia bacterium]|nr:hypothetical protein [Kiritimatiellia bacterium]